MRFEERFECGCELNSATSVCVFDAQCNTGLPRFAMFVVASIGYVDHFGLLAANRTVGANAFEVEIDHNSKALSESKQMNLNLQQIILPLHKHHAVLSNQRVDATPIHLHTDLIAAGAIRCQNAAEMYLVVLGQVY